MIISNQKTNFYYTRLISFRVSRVSSTHLRGFAPGPHIKVSTVASCWQRVGDWIGSGFEPHTKQQKYLIGSKQ